MICAKDLEHQKYEWINKTSNNTAIFTHFSEDLHISELMLTEISFQIVIFQLNTFEIQVQKKKIHIKGQFMKLFDDLLIVCKLEFGHPCKAERQSRSAPTMMIPVK